MQAATARTGAAVTTTLDALFPQEYAPMMRLGTLLVGSDAVAEELVQDALVAVHRRWSSVDNPGGYLRTSVVNACRSHQRCSALERRRAPRPDEAAQLGADEVWDALDRLPTGSGSPWCCATTTTPARPTSPAPWECVRRRCARSSTGAWPS